MKRYMRFLPIILAALALAASGSNIVLRNASAQLGSTPKGGAPKVEAQLSAAAAQQISALLQEKYSRTPAQKKISMHLQCDEGAARRGDDFWRRGHQAEF